MSEEEGGAPVTRADFAKLFSALTAMESKVSNLKRELAEEQEAAHERLAKRMKLDRAPIFKKKAHEKQYYFNETVKDKIQEAHIYGSVAVDASAGEGEVRPSRR